jgi:hypothetical protein
MNNHAPAPVVELIGHGSPAGFLVIPEARRHRPPPSHHPNFGL